MEKLTEYVSGKILGNMALTAAYGDGETERLIPAVTENGKTTEWVYTGTNIECGSVRAVHEDGTTVFFADFKTKKPLAGMRCIRFGVSFSSADEVVASYHDKDWWMLPSFPKSASGEEPMRRETENLIVHSGALHYALTTLCGDIFRCDAEGDELALSIRCEGFSELHGPFLAVTASTEPIKAVENNYLGARKMGAIPVPLIAERPYPELFEYFGWCTWNTFYQNVTSEGIYKKLTEFKEKKVPIKWMIIDDGWSVLKDNKLLGLGCDKNKFPEGLDGCVRRIKEEFGVEYVGVWHAFNGYWDGIHPESDINEKYADCLVSVEDGMTKAIPSPFGDDSFRFWDDWHEFIEKSGVDFLKVDNQSSSYRYLKNTLPTVVGARNTHAALERSINKHFGGIVINCMGMDMENVLSRPGTAVTRNSDDFFPDIPNGFAKHIAQNVYSAIWHSQMYHCDYDMWWSGRSAPVQSGLLRALSGGPVYVSDAMGETNPDNIFPVCGHDGDLCRLDGAAMPTADCVYTDCEKEKRLLKIFNRSGDAFVLGAFNISGCEISESFDFDVIPGISKEIEYIAYEYFTKKFTRVNFSEACALTLPSDGVACYNLYPIVHPDPKTDEGAYILLGDTERYVSVSSRTKVKVGITELLKK